MLKYLETPNTPALNPMVKNRARAMSNLSTVQRQSAKKPQNIGSTNPAFYDANQLDIQPRPRAATNMSTVSVGSMTLTPFAKNRARAMSNLSGYDAISLQPATDQVRTYNDYLWEIFTPWEPEDFNEGSILDKILCIVVSPIYFCCKITCPVVGENEKDTWNRPLTVIQGFCIPWAFYLLLKQYGTEPFGDFPRWSVAMIISVALSAGL